MTLKVLESFVSDARSCSYLPAEQAVLEYRVMLDVPATEWESMLSKGWRRFGAAYFRPKCPACSECVSLRIPVKNFKPSRNQSRALRNISKFRLEIGPPLIDQERLQLYQEWHDLQGQKRDWELDSISADRYFYDFAFPHECAREFAYYDDSSSSDRPVIVAIVDETENALSAVYTFYDPKYAKLSPGTGSIVRQIEIARSSQKEYVYLGYRVLNCASSEYKGRFRPHELLAGRPGEFEEPTWTTIVKG
ncbi:MAG: arginyltransferase [Myxococcota bacterium]|nr:arginyltransferase [Myxococcota bacterium]